MKKKLLYFSIKVIVIISIVILFCSIFGDRNDYNLINQGKPIIFAHRGHVNLSVENSVESFLKSDSIGFNAIETDISCSKDGKLIIFHDEACKRLLGVDSNIVDLNWRDITQKHLIFNGKHSSNKVLSLDAFLSQTRTSKILYLDIKETSKSIADSLLQILEKHNDHKNIIVADADLLFLTYLKIINPNLRVALEGFNKGKEWQYYIIPTKYKPDYYSSFLSQVDEDHIEFLKKHNLIKNKITYGVDIGNIQEVFKFGIQNIILDYDKIMGNINDLETKLYQGKP